MQIATRVIATWDALEKPAPDPAHWAETDDATLLCAIATTAELIDRTREHLQHQVVELRRRDVGWDAIGASLGVSRQMAEERFR